MDILYKAVADTERWSTVGNECGTKCGYYGRLHLSIYSSHSGACEQQAPKQQGSSNQTSKYQRDAYAKHSVDSNN